MPRPAALTRAEVLMFYFFSGFRYPFRFGLPVFKWVFAGPVLAYAAVSIFAACSSPYLKSRKKDAADVFTFEISRKTYGASLRAGPLKTGLSYTSPDTQASGLRGGSFGSYYTAGFAAIFFGADYYQEKPFGPLLTGNLDQASPPLENKDDSADNADTTENLENAESLDSIKSANSIKSAESAGASTGDTTGPAAEAQQYSEPKDTGRSIRRKLYRARSPTGLMEPTYLTHRAWKDEFGKPESALAPRSYFTDLQLQAGLYYGFRVGFNPGELLDLVLGVTTLDIMDDDYPIDPVERKLRNHPLFDFLDDKGRAALRQAVENGTIKLPE